jgi:hypothetical protein
MVEDLTSSPPFCSYPRWDGAAGPSLGFRRYPTDYGCQVGAMTRRAPLLPFNLAPDERFQQALPRAQQPLPYEDIPVSWTCSLRRQAMTNPPSPYGLGVNEPLVPTGHWALYRFP